MTPRLRDTLGPLVVVVMAGVVIAMTDVRAFQTQDQGTTFRSRREVVRVDALVTDHARPVKGLKPSDFQVLDNGVPQTVDLVLFEEMPINAILALDLSGSVAGDRLNHLRGASRALLDALKTGDRAALIGFSHIVELGAALTPDLTRVLSWLDRTRAAGGTALVDASYAGLVIGESDAGRSLELVFSDGVDTSSWLSADSVLDTAKRSATVVYGVSVSGTRPVFLRDLSGLTGGSMFEVESTKSLDAAFVNIINEFRERYLLSYSPKGVAADGWHRIDLTIKGRGNLTVKARPGYQSGS